MNVQPMWSRPWTRDFLLSSKPSLRRWAVCRSPDPTRSCSSHQSELLHPSWGSLCWYVSLLVGKPLLRLWGSRVRALGLRWRDGSTHHAQFREHRRSLRIREGQDDEACDSPCIYRDEAIWWRSLASSAAAPEGLSGSTIDLCSRQHRYDRLCS